MYTYRITKYNPKFRDETGAYTKEEWTEFSDIGKKFNGEIFTIDEYEHVESAYINTLFAFLEENNITKLKIGKIQNFRNIEFGGKVLKANQIYNLQDLREIFRLILRDEFWAKFKNKDRSFVDFGGDYYTYIGVPRQSQNAIEFAEKNRLYVEEYPEPILD